jgi:hypothetical protein
LGYVERRIRRNGVGYLGAKGEVEEDGAVIV